MVATPVTTMLVNFLDLLDFSRAIAARIKAILSTPPARADEACRPRPARTRHTPPCPALPPAAFRAGILRLASEAALWGYRGVGRLDRARLPSLWRAASDASRGGRCAPGEFRGFGAAAVTKVACAAPGRDVSGPGRATDQLRNPLVFHTNPRRFQSDRASNAQIRAIVSMSSSLRAVEPSC